MRMSVHERTLRAWEGALVRLVDRKHREPWRVGREQQHRRWREFEKSLEVRRNDLRRYGHLRASDDDSLYSIALNKGRLG